MRCTLLAVLALSLACAAFADKVVLKDGKVYEGTVVEQTESSVRIRTAKAVLTFPMERVASIEKGDSLVAERDRLTAAIDPATPASYLKLAQWLAGSGREFFDPKLFVRLCEIATHLDPALGYDAQSLLSRHLEESGDTRGAALALKRALLSRPGDEAATKALAPLEKELAAKALEDVREFAKALDQINCDLLDSALERMQKIDPRVLPGSPLKALKKSFEAFRADIASRVPCRNCRGAQKLVCPDCAGKGEIICAKCQGKAVKPDWVGRADAADRFAESACPECCGVGSRSCRTCGARRPISIQFRAGAGTAKQPVQVIPEPGKDREALEKQISLSTYKAKDGGAVSAIVPCKATAGGEIVCPGCKGALFAPPMEPVDRVAIKDCLEELKPYSDGKRSLTPFGDEIYDRCDKAAVADGNFRLRNGRWTK